jgi:shikimate kinase
MLSSQSKPERHADTAPPDPVRRIVLTGFMGSGKTTVGPLVAARLGWRFIDVDDVIVSDTGMPISEFFARNGEAVFRDRERETIARFAAQDGLVLALGGGAIEIHTTRDLLMNTPGTLVVHLHIDLATTLSRCGGTEEVRPILADQANLLTRYERRLPLYRMAHITIAADALTPEQVAEAIVHAKASQFRPD